MEILFAWVLTGLVLAAPYPWAVWLLNRSPVPLVTGWLALLLTLALSTGGLALVMLWLALLRIALSLPVITLAYCALMLPGLLVWWQAGRPILRPTAPQSRWEAFALAVILLVSVGILFNALYWPFSRADAIGIYHRYGWLMYRNTTLVPLPGNPTLYETYPILISLHYTFAYLASGWTNQYLARLFPALLSLGCIPAGYTLGKLLHSRGAGWLSALLIVVTPAFTTWASSGYVDLPMAFFYMLTAIFAWRLWQHGSLSDALLAGVSIGLATFTKNAALIGVVTLAAWLLWGWWQQRISLRAILLALLVTALIGAPWYVRNLMLAGMIIPPTAWTDQAEPSVSTLLVFITRPGIYGLPGLLILVSVLVSGLHVIRQRLDAPRDLLLLGFTLPFFAAWWLFVSYDPRFVLLFVPVLCVLAGIWGVEAWAHLPAAWQRRLVIPLAALLLVLTLQAAVNSIEYKANILENPLMSHETKRQVINRNR